MKALADAIRFLTILPVPRLPRRRKGNGGIGTFDPSRALAAYPWVGLIIGVLMAGTAAAGSFVFGAGGIAVVVVVAKIVITGGLHLDGIADLADGMGGGRDPARRLEIMRDSRIGSFGVLAIVSILALQIVLIREIVSPSPGGVPALELLSRLVLIPVLSRGVVPLFVRAFPTARPDGSGSAARSGAGIGVVAAALVGTVLITGLLSGIPGLFVALGTILLLVPAALTIRRSLGGLTGDAYGALIESGEVFAALGILVAGRLGFLPAGPIFG